MPYRQALKEEAEIAKATLLNSDLEERNKKTLLHLINTSTEAISSSTIEEKFQKTAEVISGLVLTQITFLDCVDKKIDSTINDHCKTCKAMQHTQEYNEKIQQEHFIEDWKRSHNLVEADKMQSQKFEEKTWSATIKEILTRPSAWVFLTIAIFSPYSVPLIELILNFFK